MKKFLLILVVFSLILTSCKIEPDVLSFEEAVLEVYDIVGRIFYYPDRPNRVSGSNEKSGLCGDYEMEFLLYWNEILNYDEVYGRAYNASSGQKDNNSVFGISDVKFVPKGTGILPWNDKYDLGVGEIIGTRIPLLLHYGEYPYEHGWPVIFYEGEWYGCDPTWWDAVPGNQYLPYKFTF